jgi:hypothetical protein
VFLAIFGNIESDVGEEDFVVYAGIQRLTMVNEVDGSETPWLVAIADPSSERRVSRSPWPRRRRRPLSGIQKTGSDRDGQLHFYVDASLEEPRLPRSWSGRLVTPGAEKASATSPSKGQPSVSADRPITIAEGPNRLKLPSDPLRGSRGKFGYEHCYESPFVAIPSNS